MIHRQHATWGNSTDAVSFAEAYSNMGLGNLFLPTSARRYGMSRNKDITPVPDRYTTVNSEEVYKGRPCYKAVLTQDMQNDRTPLVTDYYIDKSHGMLVSIRTKGMYHIPKGGNSSVFLNVDQVTVITYGPPTENGLPFPVSVKGSYVWPTGRREPMTDIEFTEFRRYKPTADELDFEKQFGIPLPALPPKPTASSGSTLGKLVGGGGRTKWWLLGGLAVVSLTALAVYLRRRRARKVEPLRGTSP